MLVIELEIIFFYYFNFSYENVQAIMTCCLPCVQGVYKIKVRSSQTTQTTVKEFKIEDYVLPRFEVTLKPPSYVLADSEILKLEVCAK